MSNQKPADRRPIASVFRRLGDAPVRLCVQLGVHPNVISIASLVAAILAAACFLFVGYSPWLGLVGVGFCFLRLYFNMLDGMVAIAANKVTPSGEIANELPDRISDVLIFSSAAYSMMSAPWLGNWCAILSLIVAYVGTLGKAAGVHRDFSGPMSKPWRMVLLSIGVIANSWQFAQPFGPSIVMAPITAVDIACVLIAVGCVITIVRRMVRIIKALNAKHFAAQKSFTGAAANMGSN